MQLLIFMIGTCFGSFISCMSHRYITHESILGRSHCDYCGHTLHVLDLIPVLSYILLKGQCRYCHHKLNKSLLVHELTAGFLFILFYIHDGLSILYLSHIASFTCFYIISIIDLHLYEIPDIYLLISLVCSFKIIYLKESFLFILFLILFVYLFYKITGKEGLGGGDIKMLGVCSLSLGIYQTLSILSIACFLGIIFSFIKQKKMIPFGPFIALGWLTISLFDSFLIL